MIETPGLEISKTSGNFTPAKAKPLVKDADGDPALGDCIDSSVVGMLLCHAGQTKPDIAYQSIVVLDACLSKEIS